MHEIDESSYEIGAVQLSLRSDLSFRRQSFGGDVCYVIEDSARSQFFRIGVAEYTFASLLDGQTSIAAAVAEAATRLGSDAFTESQAGAFCGWLVDTGLASTPQSLSTDRLAKGVERSHQKRRKEWLNPIMLKLPFGNPDIGFRRLLPFACWIFSVMGVVCWLSVLVVGCYHATANWEQLWASSPILASNNWVWLAITWMCLKVTHETAHGLACQHFGGETREAGVLLLLFVPLPYVDVTCTWRFGSKWKRIAVSAAGIYAEMFIAACAAILWAYTDSAVVQHHAANIMATAGFATIVFNINPLMKFDGYHILTDLLELPNLATHGQQDLVATSRQWLLGIPGAAKEWPEGRLLVIRSYGIAAFLWRIVICVSLVFAAEGLYHGAGVILAATAVLLWVVVPTLQFLRYFVVGDAVNPPDRQRFVCIASVCCGLVYLTWNYVPYVERMQLPAVVDYDPAVTVRSATAGFVTQVSVAAGDKVLAGDTLFQLENPELAARITDTSLAIAKSRLDATVFHRANNLAAWQVEQENEASLQTRLNELNQQAAALIVTAPSDGMVLSGKTEDLLGRWVTSGTELVVLGDDALRTIRFVVSQAYIEDVRQAATKPISIHIWGFDGDDASGTIKSIAPRGSVELKDSALATLAGGPLAVEASSQNDSHSKQNAEQRWQLLEPHFTGFVQPSKQLNLQDHGIGQRGYIELVTRRQNIGQALTQSVARLLDDRPIRQ